MISVETTSIRITSRASVKIKDNFYTVEYCEERAIHFDAKSDKTTREEELNEEREKLWNDCNNEVDNQIKDIVDMCNNNR